MSYKTTKKDFEEFKTECLKWQKYFGLIDWEIFFDHKDVGNNFSACSTNIPGKVATLSLSTKFSVNPIKNEIKKTAFHEICELLLCQLGTLAENFFNKSIVDEQVHYVIRILENTVFEDLR